MFELPTDAALCCDGTPCADSHMCQTFGLQCPNMDNETASSNSASVGTTSTHSMACKVRLQTVPQPICASSGQKCIKSRMLVLKPNLLAAKERVVYELAW
jgi:hypothetical protein